jgi:hypothetical protein
LAELTWLVGPVDRMTLALQALLTGWPQRRLGRIVGDLEGNIAHQVELRTGEAELLEGIVWIGPPPGTTLQ